MTDILLPRSEEPTETDTEAKPTPPVKARRARQPKAQSGNESPASLAADEGVPAESASPEADPISDGKPSAGPTDVSDSPTAASPMQQAAAQWNAETGAATFDWPAIEQVAAAGGPNQAMAKLLLAARAEGANSRWPF